MSSAYTVEPVFANVNLVTFNEGTPTTTNVSNDLVEAQITLSADSMTGQTIMTIRDDHYQYGTPGSPDFQPGDLMQVYLYKKGQSTTANQVFCGPIVSLKYKKDFGGHHNQYMLVRAQDGSAFLQNRMVNAAYMTYAVQSNPGYLVGQIVEDLILNEENWMAYQYGASNLPSLLTYLGSSSENIGIGGVQNVPVYIQNVQFQQMSLFSALSQLAQYAGCTFFMSPASSYGQTLNFFQVSEGNPAPAQILDNNINAWECEDDGTNIQNVIYVDGGTQLTVDSSNQLTEFVSSGVPPYAISTYVSGQTSAYTSPIAAQQFTAGNLDLTEIGLILSVQQANPLVPVVPLSGAIAYDDGLNLPAQIDVGESGPVLYTVNNSQFTISQVYSTSQLEQIASSGGDPFVYIDVTSTLEPGQKYWIVLNAAFNDNADFYYWYASAGFSPGTGPWATTTNGGESWTVQQTPGGPFCFKVMVQNGVLAAAVDTTSISTYNNLLYESSVTSLGQTTGYNAQPVAQGFGQYLLGTNSQNYGLGKKKRFLRLHTLVPDTPILPGQPVNVTCNDMQLSSIPFTAVQVQYDIRDVSCFDTQVWLQRFQWL